MFAGRVLDAGDERLGRRQRGKFRDDQASALGGRDAGADAGRAQAVLHAGGVHEPALREVREHLERLLAQGADLRFEQLREVVWQDARGKAHRDAVRAKHQEQRQFAGQEDRLLVAAVIAGHERGQCLVEDLLARKIGQPALDVTRGGGIVAGHDVAEVALALDQVALVDERDEGIADGGIAVGMVLHRVADHVGDLDEAAVILLRERVHDPPLHRLEAVRQVGNGAFADDVGGVLQKVVVHHAPERTGRMRMPRRFVALLL